ncbi:Hsp70 family protein [Noviherbaspirillum sp. UKPF54]|uniref:Hsp70 family protein n=1 Tax=Noviherbaspirillum sp. UKPF54 TaxID=2601898 RepID=UPI0011B0FF6C|nr:Hsp70 family protein [Noviherbaspirillum sp. UKPF54]QDZ27933.1 molecular chaperone DnaK [Noviherbaspirillum sp. UKPF54]
MKRFAVGIDLGTTHTVVAYAEPGGSDIRLFDIEQLVAPGEVKALPLLPSLRFHPAPGELPASELQLPWAAAGDSGQEPVVIGMLARKLGAQVPGRLVASAKSWLSHGAVDRMAPILPWGAADDVRKVSPVQASASYLAHVRAAWNWQFPQHPLEEQEIVLTVPASFDEGARELTLNAARMAGLPRLRLLEEPQAAFYDWLFRHRASLAGELADTRLILVCDVGGGTTDLSLITAGMRDGQPQLTRIGVGKHLMLGGDNMDLVLAHIAESRLTPANGGSGAGQRLSAGRLSQLLERCRAAKEQLLGPCAPAAVTVTLLGAGSRVIGGSRSAELTREEAARVILDGFFPAVAPTEPVQQRRSGIVEFGLPYASDPAITRHIAAFLQRHAAAARGALGLPDAGDARLPMPDTLLLNGGVFRSDLIVQQLESTLADWRGAPLRLLDNNDPDVAVARGAVAYTLARSGLGARIGGGSPRSYFLVLDDRSHGRQGVCVLPRGSEQGKEVLLPERSFALRLGQPVRFHLVSSTAGESGGRPHRAGELVDLDGGDFVQLPPIATVLRGAAAGAKAEIPVQLATALTEIGTLEMHCVSIDDPDQRWKLEFQLRGDGTDATESDATADLPPRFSEALARIDRIFGTRAQKVEPREVRQLRAQLEKLIGQREGWPTPLLRRLADALIQRARGRRRSADHERVWLNLTGYCLRPGFGYPLDDWRTGQLWALFEAGAQYRNDVQVCAEWWTMWRRVAGGLETEAQLRLLDDFAQNVAEDEVPDRPPGLVKGSYDDMLRLVAALERIPASYKAEIGDWLLGLLGKDKPQRRGVAVPDSLVLWTLARVGARQPFHGSAHDVVPPETAAAWVDAIMALDWKHQEAAPFAAAHVARLTGDRSRDLPQATREQVIRRLEAAGAPQAWTVMIREAVQLDESGERSFLGDSLPPGLKLIA